MSTPGTPERQLGDSPPAGDPLTVRPAARSYISNAGDDEDASSRPSSPFSFKRKSSAASPSPGFLGGVTAGGGDGSARRSLSNFFSRRASNNTGQAAPPPTNNLSLPPTPSFGGGSGGHNRSLLSPQGTPTRRASGAVRGGRKVSSASAAARGHSRGLSPGAISPGGLRGRINDWQRTASYTPGNASEDVRSNRSDGGASGDDDEDDDVDDLDFDFEASRLENEPIIPKMLPELRTPEHQTPLPKLPVIVLAIWYVSAWHSQSFSSLNYSDILTLVVISSQYGRRVPVSIRRWTFSLFHARRSWRSRWRRRKCSRLLGWYRL